MKNLILPVLHWTLWLFSIFALLPHQGFAFETIKTTSGKNIRWYRSSLPVPYFINASGSADISGNADIQAVKDSFNSWQKVPCSYLAFDYRGTTSMSTTGNDNVNLVVWRENNWPPQFGASAIGVTTPIHNSVNGQILDADIQFNGQNYTWTTSPSMRVGSGNTMDVSNIATHEIGHLLGLDHPPIAAATMYYASPANSIKSRTLHQDDMAGICYLYPANPGGLGTPCESVSNCNQGLCLQTDQGRYCSKSCSIGGSDCPNGYHCKGTGLSQPSNACFIGEPEAKIGQDCSDASCEKGLTCVNNANDKPVCFRSCNPQSPVCPTGDSCHSLKNSEGKVQGGICIKSSGEGGICGQQTSCDQGLVCLILTQGSESGTCHKECDPQQTSPCGAEKICLDLKEGQGACFNASSEGEPCGKSTACQKDHICLVQKAGEDNGICFKSCQPGPSTGQCLSTQICLELSSPGQGVCYLAADENEICGKGVACNSNLVCLILALGDSTGYCKRKCEPSNPTSCKSGERCTALSNGGACLPNPRQQGEFCDKLHSCSSSLICYSHLGARSICYRTCNSNDIHSCGAGFTCMPTNFLGSGYCLEKPKSNDGGFDYDGGTNDDQGSITDNGNLQNDNGYQDENLQDHNQNDTTGGSGTLDGGSLDGDGQIIQEEQNNTDNQTNGGAMGETSSNKVTKATEGERCWSGQPCQKEMLCHYQYGANTGTCYRLCQPGLINTCPNNYLCRDLGHSTGICLKKENQEETGTQSGDNKGDGPNSNHPDSPDSNETFLLENKSQCACSTIEAKPGQKTEDILMVIAILSLLMLIKSSWRRCIRRQLRIWRRFTS